MTNVMKKVSALLLAAAMLVSMMPFVTAEANAETNYAIKVFVNGKDTGRGVTQEWLNNCQKVTQVMPFVAGQGKKYGYIVAAGPTIDSVLNESMGLVVADLDDNMIIAGGQSVEGTWKLAKNSAMIDVANLKNATDLTCLKDQNGNPVPAGASGFTSNDYTTVTASALDNPQYVKPIIATAYDDKGYTLENATAMLSTSWQSAATKKLRMFVGGNLTTSDKEVKKDGTIQDGSVNFTGRFTLTADSGNTYAINIQVPETNYGKLKMGTYNFSSESQQKIECPLDMPTSICDALTSKGTWETDNNVATVANGVITPVGIGSCTVKVTVPGYYTGTAKVNVSADAFKPAQVTGLKVKNVKKKSAKLTWNAVNKADGYVVYRATKKKGKYKAVATVQGQNNTVYLNKKLKKHRNYYYKLTAVRTVSGQTLASDISAYKRVYIKK